jgi:Dolichyl-phosphate-mannose-protein mannosyltransferase
MLEGLGLIGALAGLLPLGAGTLLVLGLWSESRGILRLIVALFTGIAVAVVALPPLVYVRVAPSVSLVLGLGVAVLLLGLFLERRRSLEEGAGIVIGRLPALVLAPALLVLAARAWVQLGGAYDAFSNWGLKAKLLYFSGSGLLDERIFEAVFASNGSPPVERTYPLGLPALEAYVMHAMGGPNFRVLHVLFVVFLAGVAAITWMVLRPRVDPVTLTAGIALLLWMPAVRDQALSQNADVPVASFWVAAVLLLSAWIHRSDVRLLALAGVFAAAAAATKREGSIFVILLIVLAAGVLLWRREPRRLGHLGLAAVIVAATVLPWRLFVAVNGLTGHDIAVSPVRLVNQADTLPDILFHLGKVFIDPVYLAVGPLAVLAAILLLGRPDGRALGLAFLTLMGGLLLILVLVYVQTRNQLEPLLVTSARRTLITPAMLAAASLPFLVKRLFATRCPSRPPG